MIIVENIPFKEENASLKMLYVTEYLEKRIFGMMK